MTVSDWNLIIVGAGLAGLAAANRALDLGRRPLVLERSTEARHLCASRVNGGVFHVGFRSIRSNPDDLVKVIDRATGGFVRPELAAGLTDNAARAIGWLERMGVEFTAMTPDDGWKDCVLAPLGFHERTTLSWDGLGADRLVYWLEQQVNERGGRSIRGVEVRDLVVEDGVVVGVIANTEDGQVEYRAPAILLADGGFEANEAMIREFISPNPQNLKLRGVPSGNGDGMRMARAVGGELVGMEAFYGHLLSADSLTSDRLCPFPFLDFLASTGMMVDAASERFVDETTGGHFTSNVLARHGDGLATVLFDDAMWNGIGRHFFCPPNPNLVEAGGTLHVAGTIGEVARLAGLDADKIEALVEDRNQACAKMAEANDEATATMTVYAKGKHQHEPFLTPPFYAAPVCAALTSTFGGIAIDANARVRRADGSTISGLFAAGSCTGGLEGGPEVGYIGGLIKSLVYGLLAAEATPQQA